VLFDAGNRWEATEIIGALASEAGESGVARLAQLVAVVDVAHFFDDLEAPFWDAEDEGRATIGATTRAERLVQDIEFASTAVLVNWQSLSTSELSTIMALVNHLGPHARLRLDQPAANLELDLGSIRREQDRAGWMGLINGEFTPYMTDPRVSGFVYEHVRPFHAGRLAAALDGDIGHRRYGRLVRSAGFCSLASRPGRLAQWSQAGAVVGFAPLPVPAPASPPLAIGQELALMGLDLDRPGLTDALDACVLTDEELAEGPLAWMAYEDSLPEWDSALR
jgi:G3E family GTPase